MSSLDDRKLALAENPYAEKTAWAMARIEEQRRAQEGYGLGVMFAFASMDEAMEENALFAKAAEAAKWASIWFFMIIPVIAMWNVVYG